MGESVQETEQCPVCSRQRGDLPLGRYYDGRACCRCRASLIVRRLIAFLIDYVAGLGLLGGAMIYATGASVIWLDVQGTLEVALLLGAWVVDLRPARGECRHCSTRVSARVRRAELALAVRPGPSDRSIAGHCREHAAMG